MPRKRQTTKSYLVFISHSTMDRWITKQMASIIEEKGLKYGLKTFLDEKDIEGGESIPESVRKNIQECKEFLVFLSPYSIDRPWVLVEVGAAWALGKHITPITYMVTPEEIPDIIRLHKAIDLNSFDEYLGQLLKRVQGE